MRSRHALPLILLGLVFAAGSLAAALLIDWIPIQASEQSERVDQLLWFVIFASIGIFTIVATFATYSVLRFRAKPDDESDGPPIHGNTRLEVIWTIIPTLLLAAVAVWAYIVLSDNEALASDRMVVEVTAEQFAWSYRYPDANVGAGDLHLPVDRQVELRMRSKDVIHSFYVKEFRVKQDVVPGITTRLIIDTTREGTFQVICAELCGVGHGVMRSRVIVHSQEDFDAWLQNAQRQTAAQPEANQTPEASAGDESDPGQDETVTARSPEDQTQAPESEPGTTDSTEGG
jgi:cytochrome c oxidase subunit 2